MDRYEIIWKSVQKHGYKYDYRKINSQKTLSDGIFICDKHGEFKQMIKNHLAGSGCYYCGREKTNDSKRVKPHEFIERAKKIHQLPNGKPKYVYDTKDYVGYYDNMRMICKIHGEFYQTPANHLNGEGCYKCGKIEAGRKKALGKEEFIRRAIKKHTLPDGYIDFIYDNVEYKNQDTDVIIFSKSLNKTFKQSPSNHLKCSSKMFMEDNKSKLEEYIEKFLIENNLNYIHLYRNKTILSKQSLDFYLPDLNVAIECQGVQHFKDKHFSEGLNIIIERDIRKNKICLENGIKLLYYTQPKLINEDILNNPIFQGIYTKDNLISDKDKLIEAIFKSS